MNIILKIGEFDYNQKCDTINETPLVDGRIFSGNHFKEADISIDIDPTEELIRKVLSLSDDADKAFKESCSLFNVTIDEQLDNQRRQRTGLLLEERIRFIKDHWKDTFYYLQHICSREGLITVKI